MGLIILPITTSSEKRKTWAYENISPYAIVDDHSPIPPRRNLTSVTVLKEQEERELNVNCIATYSKGFICSGGSGTLHIFEKTDDKYTYRKARSVSIWVDPNSNYVPTTGADSVTNDILSMTLSPSEENVVCSTRTQQLYNLTLSAADLQGKVG